jgi:putative membrane protein
MQNSTFPSPARLCSAALTGLLITGSAIFSTSLYAAPLAAADQAFFVKAAQSDETEIAASKAAASKASAPEVKAFAENMIKDHTTVSDQLKELASKKGVKLPAQPSAAQQASLDAMSKMSATAFDQRYASEIGLAAHQEAVALYQKTAESAKDPDVKAFAAKNLPDLRHHLEMAKELKTATTTAKK